MSVFTIIIGEQNDEDYLLIKSALSKLTMNFRFEHVTNGKCLLENLSWKWNNKTRLPDLVLMELNMPNVDAQQVLKLIRGNSHFCHLPVAVYTSLWNNEQKTGCQRLGANAIFQKPVKQEETSSFAENVRHFFACWNLSQEVKFYDFEKQQNITS